MTAPSKVWDAWAAASFPLPGKDFSYRAVDRNGKALKPIPHKEIDLTQAWEDFDIRHELTVKGIQQFVADYRNTLTQSA